VVFTAYFQVTLQATAFLASYAPAKKKEKRKERERKITLLVVMTQPACLGEDPLLYLFPSFITVWYIETSPQLARSILISFLPALALAKLAVSPQPRSLFPSIFPFQHLPASFLLTVLHSPVSFHPSLPYCTHLRHSIRPLPYYFQGSANKYLVSITRTTGYK